MAPSFVARYLNGRALALPFAAAAITLAACSGEPKKTPESDLARDLALASTQPTQLPATFQDTAIAPAPTPTKAQPEPKQPTPQRSSPSPKPTSQAPRRESPPPAPQPAPVEQHATPAPTPAPAPAPAPAAKEIAAGTGVALSSTSRVCTTNLPGDKIVATVNTAVTGANGAVIPVGSTVVLEVASVTGTSAENMQIGFRVKGIVINDQTYPVAAEVTPLATLEKSKVADGDPNSGKKKVIGGAIAGAILGQMIGKNTKGTLIGAAAGAATGAAVAKNGEQWEGCLPQGSPMRLTLNSTLVM